MITTREVIAPGHIVAVIDFGDYREIHRAMIQPDMAFSLSAVPHGNALFKLRALTIAPDSKESRDVTIAIGPGENVIDISLD